jgi:tetratricopeptide (TPR) repeat protein
MKILTVLLATVSFAATPAEMAIEKAEADIARHPEHAPYYNALALAYARRARETSDGRDYAKAEQTLQRSFAIAPDNYDGLKVRASLELGKHEYTQALETATKLNKQAPDDVMVYGFLVDAHIELGNYKEAVAAAQWMLDLRAGNIPGLTRAGILRELHGNLNGALELLRTAYDSTPVAETEDRAALATRMSHLSFVLGDLSKAESYASQVVELFPDYPAALTALAQVRIAQKRYDEAVKLLRQSYARAPRAQNLYALAEAMELARQTDESAKAFAEFERKSVAESVLADNSNHELVAYFVNHAHQPSKALEVAERELERRHDVFTLDCYALALAANGEYEAANAQMQKALHFGIKDPKILAHAGFIAQHLSQAE